jgi:octanoyl-[GcvH]:protein N-octanoyltransferase
VELLEGSAGADPALDVALPHALLGLVAQRERGPALRYYRPQATVAFGRRDRFVSGFGAAARAALQHGFAPVIRGAGGRAAAYDDGCLVLDEIVPADDAMTGIQTRFSEEAEHQALALRSLGVDARVGEVPGEYCPGQFSVNARGATKLIGAAQRIVRGAWLLSTVVVVESSSARHVRNVLEDVYAELELDWDPATTGSVADEAPGVGVEEVRRALLESYQRRAALTPAPIAASEVAAAHALLPRYRV